MERLTQLKPKLQLLLDRSSGALEASGFTGQTGEDNPKLLHIPQSVFSFFISAISVYG